MMSIFIVGAIHPNRFWRAGNNQPRAIEVNRPYLLDNFEDGPLAVARRRAREQRADRLDGLATSANHTSDIRPSKLQSEDSCSAAWNLDQHHIVRKFNQLADHELEKLSHAAENYPRILLRTIYGVTDEDE